MSRPPQDPDRGTNNGLAARCERIHDFSYQLYPAGGVCLHKYSLRSRSVCSFTQAPPSFGRRENTREKSEIHLFCASAVKRLQEQDAQLPQVRCVPQQGAI